MKESKERTLYSIFSKVSDSFHTEKKKRPLKINFLLFLFSDYNLISDFAQKCRNDIDNKACGHVRRQMHSDSNKIFYHHSQGKHLLLKVVFLQKIRWCSKKYAKSLS